MEKGVQTNNSGVFAAGVLASAESLSPSFKVPPSRRLATRISDSSNSDCSDGETVLERPRSRSMNDSGYLGDELLDESLGCEDRMSARLQQKTVKFSDYTADSPSSSTNSSTQSLATCDGDDDAWIRTLWGRLPEKYTSTPSKQNRRERCKLIFDVARAWCLPLEKAAMFIIKAEGQNPHIEWSKCNAVAFQTSSRTGRHHNFRQSRHYPHSQA